MMHVLSIRGMLWARGLKVLDGSPTFESGRQARNIYKLRKAHPRTARERFCDFR